jgi:hypothetical protein
MCGQAVFAKNQLKENQKEKESSVTMTLQPF